MSRGMKDKFDPDGNLVNQYADEKMRFSNNLFLAEVYGGTYISVEDIYDIDNQCVETEEYFEGERGDSWYGDRYDPKNYHYDRFDCGFATINGPQRKLGLWGHKSELRPDYDWKIEYYKNHIIHFVRGNKNRLQMCVVWDHVLRDPTKWKLAKPDEPVKNWEVPEHWMCVPRKYTDVWNMQLHGKYELWTPTSGFYMTKEEEKRYLEQRRLEIYRAYKKNR